MTYEPKELFKSSGVLVRLMLLGPHEVGHKHYHSSLFETIICVAGEIALFVVGEPAPIVLTPGQQASVPSPKAHWLENRSSAASQYVLAQSGGEYDFLSAA